MEKGGGPRQAPKGGTLSHLAYWNLLHTVPERFSGFFVVFAVFPPKLPTLCTPPRHPCTPLDPPAPPLPLDNLDARTPCPPQILDPELLSLDRVLRGCVLS